MKLEGSCHCKAVTFTVESHTPSPFQLCYCSVCRQVTRLYCDECCLAIRPSHMSVLHGAGRPAEAGRPSTLWVRLLRGCRAAHSRKPLRTKRQLWGSIQREHIAVAGDTKTLDVKGVEHVSIYRVRAGSTMLTMEPSRCRITQSRSYQRRVS